MHPIRPSFSLVPSLIFVKISRLLIVFVKSVWLPLAIHKQCN